MDCRLWLKILCPLVTFWFCQDISTLHQTKWWVAILQDSHMTVALNTSKYVSWCWRNKAADWSWLKLTIFSSEGKFSVFYRTWPQHSPSRSPWKLPLSHLPWTLLRKPIWPSPWQSVYISFLQGSLLPHFYLHILMQLVLSADRWHRLHSPQLHSRIPGQRSSESQGRDKDFSDYFLAEKKYFMPPYMFVYVFNVKMGGHTHKFCFASPAALWTRIHHRPGGDEPQRMCTRCVPGQGSPRFLWHPHNGQWQNGWQAGGHHLFQRHWFLERGRPRFAPEWGEWPSESYRQSFNESWIIKALCGAQ